jgi:hypothetical protein
MSSTYTSNLAIQLMGTGDQSGSWGQTTNYNMQYLEEGITGYLNYAVPNTNTVVLVLAQATDTIPSARNMIINLTTGAASGPIIMTVPGTASKLYFIWNQTTYAVTVQGTTPTANTVLIPSGAQTVVFCDGANNVYAALGSGNFTSLTVTGTSTSTSTSIVNISDASNANGVNIKMLGNGSTTPSKTLRVNSGAFQIMNDAYTATLFQVLDDGSTLVTSTSASPIGSVTVNSGPTTARFQNNSTGATVASIVRAVTGTAGSNVDYISNDNTGNPYAQWVGGTAITRFEWKINASVLGTLSAGGAWTFNAPNVASTVALTVRANGVHSTQISDSANNLYNAGYLEVPQNVQAGGSYTTVLADSGKHIYYSGSSTYSATLAATAATVAISAAATNSGGTRTQFTFTTPGFTFVAGSYITLSGMSVTAYNGTYAVISATATTAIVAVAFSATSTGTLNYCTATVSGTVTGTLAQYQSISGTGYSAGTFVTALQSGTGAVGTVVHIYPFQTVTATAIVNGPVYTIPTGIYNTGTALTVVNDGSTAAPISIYSSDTIVTASSGNTNLNNVHSLSRYGMATLLKIGTTRWLLSGSGVV